MYYCICGTGTKRRQRRCGGGPPGDNCDGAVLIEDVACSFQCPSRQFVKATCGSSLTSKAVNGIYIPIGSKNGRVLYQKEELDQNGNTWYKFFDEIQNKWKYEKATTPWSLVDDFNANSLGKQNHNSILIRENLVCNF